MIAELDRPDRLTALREMVRTSSYHVDPEAVAVAILERLRPSELLSDTDRSGETASGLPRGRASGHVLESL